MKEVVNIRSVHGSIYLVGSTKDPDENIRVMVFPKKAVRFATSFSGRFFFA
jgi:hypothetical protein